MQAINRDLAKGLIESRDDLTVVEVLDESKFREFHLPRAKNVPLGDDFEKRMKSVAPDKGKPILVYCQDMACEASTKAAQRLDAMGYEKVYDYEAGKADWKEAGLPVER